MTTQNSRVDIAFVEEVPDDELFKLKSKYFPSKVGGKPSWLALTNLPSSKQLTCDLCSNPLLFLLQIYCPIEENTSTFHRTLFIFCCVHSKCGRFFKAFRSQLKRENRFYNSEPPDYDALEDDIEYDPRPQQFGVKLCDLCGCFGDKLCSACKSVSYCSKEHQSIDWKKNGHKDQCGKENTVQVNKFLFKEFELIIENEEMVNSDTERKCEKTEDQRIQECLKFIEDRKPALQNENLDEYENKSLNDEIFNNFKKKTKLNPDQVIRYYSYERQKSSIEPLWINEEKPSSIPNCEYCGSERKLECQIMPQLLYFIEDSETDNCIDFGTLLVYTCTESCSENPDSYFDEYIFVQNFKD